MGWKNEAPAEAGKRCRGLVHLLGIGEEEAGDTSIRGRLSIIEKLKMAKRAEISRGQTGSWLYDVNRHLNICAFLRQECEALERLLSDCERKQPPRLRLVSTSREPEGPRL